MKARIRKAHPKHSGLIIFHMWFCNASTVYYLNSQTLKGCPYCMNITHLFLFIGYQVYECTLNVVLSQVVYNMVREFSRCKLAKHNKSPELTVEIQYHLCVFLVSFTCFPSCLSLIPNNVPQLLSMTFSVLTLNMLPTGIY